MGYFDDITPGGTAPATKKKTTGYFDDVTAAAEEAAPTVETPAPRRPVDTDALAATTLGGVARNIAGDLATVAVKGGVGVVDAGVGLADIATSPIQAVTMGKTGQLGKGLDAATEALFGGTRRDLRQFAEDELSSPLLKAQREELRAAQGFTDTVKAGLTNPMAIGEVAGESLPLSIGGAAAATRLLGKELVKKSPWLAALVSEGLMSSGAQQEGVRQETETGDTTLGQTGLAAVTGAGTGVLSALSNKIGGKLGLEDIDLLGSGVPVVGKPLNRIVRAVAGALNEAGEELPQSAWEQLTQNLALGKPMFEGVPEAAATGALSGGVTGGGLNLIRTGPKQETAPPAPRRPATWTDAEGNVIQSKTPAVTAPVDAIDERINAAAQSVAGLTDVEIDGTDLNATVNDLLAEARQGTELETLPVDLTEEVPRDDAQRAEALQDELSSLDTEIIDLDRRIDNLKRLPKAAQTAKAAKNLERLQRQRAELEQRKAITLTEEATDAVSVRQENPEEEGPLPQLRPDAQGVEGSVIPGEETANGEVRQGEEEIATAPGAPVGGSPSIQTPATNQAPGTPLPAGESQASAPSPASSSEAPQVATARGMVEGKRKPATLFKADIPGGDKYIFARDHKGVLWTIKQDGSKAKSSGSIEALVNGAKQTPFALPAKPAAPAAPESPPVTVKESLTAETNTNAAPAPAKAPDAPPAATVAPKTQPGDITRRDGSPFTDEKKANAARMARKERDNLEVVKVGDGAFVLRLTEKAQDKAATSAEITEVMSDPRLKRKAFRDMIADFVGGNTQVSGSRQTAGEFVGQQIRNEAGDVVGRVPSPNAKELQPAIEMAGSVQALRNAVEKASNGEKLGIAQARAVKMILDAMSDQRRQIDNRSRRNLLSLVRARAGRQGLIEQSAPQLTDEDFRDVSREEYPEDWDAETNTLADLSEAADNVLGKDAVDAILDSVKSDAQIAADLYSAIAKGKTDGRESKSRTGVAQVATREEGTAATEEVTPRTEQTPDGEQVKAFATPPTFGKTSRDKAPGVGKTGLDFTLDEPEADLFAGDGSPLDAVGKFLGEYTATEYGDQTAADALTKRGVEPGTWMLETLDTSTLLNQQDQTYLGYVALGGGQYTGGSRYGTKAEAIESLRKTAADFGIELQGGPSATPAPAIASPDAKGDAKTPAVPIEATLAGYADFRTALRDGDLTEADFKATFTAILAGKEGLTAELETLTKPQLFERFPDLQWRYKNEKKAEIVRAAYRSMLTEFVLGDSLSYGMGKNSFENAVQAKVDGYTQADLDQFAADFKQNVEERKQRVAEMAEAVKDPKTLEDFTALLRIKMSNGLSFTEARLTLTPEQRAAYDSLAGEKTRSERKDRRDDQRNQVRTAEQKVSGEIIETTHTQKGHALFVVQLSERVSKEDYTTLNAAAKKLGGYYSSFRGRGAVPGFQFKTRDEAEAFNALAGGDKTAAQEAVAARRDAFEDDSSQSAVERLRNMADALEERAQASLNQERKANTSRRASMAASAEAAANSQIAMAKTMRNLADAVESGAAQFLDRVRQKVQIEYLAEAVRLGRWNELRAKYPNYADRERQEGSRPTIESADFADWPTYTMYRSDLARLGRELMDKEGTKKIGQQILKYADDVTDAYLKFAKDNLTKVATFARKDGGLAAFASKDMAEAAIARSGYKGKAIVLPLKRGENLIIMSPSEAVERGVWQGDNDKRITLPAELGAELVTKVGRSGKVKVPWQLETVHQRRELLKRMGIEQPAEFRAALREFIGLQENAQGPDKIKQMERAMIGRRNDGLDFFPTPQATADAMIEAAEIEEGMSVLEPSAGMGHIAERIREAGVDPDVIELSNDRKELLEAKGFNVVGRDFMDMDQRGFTYGDTFRHKDGRLGIMRGSGGLGSGRVGFIPEGATERTSEWVDRDDLTGVSKNGSNSGYDRIIMNPPFSDRRDAEHVQHAYELLKPGGRIVAIMGEGVFFGNDKKAREFRDWLDELGATSEKLEDGTFLDSSLPVNTGVNARMVVIDKPSAKPETKETDTGVAMYQRQPFYSAVSRMVQDAKQDRWGSAQELVKWLTGKVSQAEIEALDLASIEGKPTKQAVIDHIKANTTEFEDVVLGEPGYSVRLTGGRESFSSRAEALSALEDENEWIDNESAIVNEYEEDRSIRVSDHEGNITAEYEYDEENEEWQKIVYSDIRETFDDYDDALADAEREAERIRDDWRGEISETPDVVDGTGSQFNSYVLPGAVEGSYREMFVTAPGVPEEPVAKVPLQWKKATENMLIADLPTGNMVTIFHNNGVDAELQVLTPDAVDVGAPQQFPTVDAAKAAAEGVVSAKHQNIVGAWQDGHSQYSSISNPIVRVRYNERTGPNGERILFVEEMQPPTKANFAKMPNWLQDRAYLIGVKRIIALAKEQGFDGVAWTTAEQQNERWGTERVDWKKNADGTFTVSMKEQEGGNAGGVNIEEEARRRGELLEERGTAVASKEDLLALVKRNIREGVAENITDKVWAQMQAEAEGTFKPRYEFFKSIYGDVKGAQNLASLFAKYGKEKVGTVGVRIDGRNEKGTYVVGGRMASGEYGIFLWAENGDKKLVAKQETKQDAERYAESLNVTGGVSPDQPFLPITANTPGEFSKFKRQSGATSGSTQADVEAAFAEANFKGLRNLVVIRQSVSEFPAGLQRTMERDGQMNAAGVYWEGKIYIAADNVNPRTAQLTFLHEGRHAGLDRIFGSALDKRRFLAQVAMAKGKEVTAWLKENTKPGRDGKYTQEQRLEAAEEWLVDSVRRGEGGGIIDKFVAKVAEWVRRIFPNLKLTKAEMRVLIAGVDTLITEGPSGARYIGSLSPAYSRDKIIAGYINRDRVEAAIRSANLEATNAGTTVQTGDDGGGESGPDLGRYEREVEADRQRSRDIFQAAGFGAEANALGRAADRLIELVATGEISHARAVELFTNKANTLSNEHPSVKGAILSFSEALREAGHDIAQGTGRPFIADLMEASALEYRRYTENYRAGEGVRYLRNRQARNRLSSPEWKRHWDYVRQKMQDKYISLKNVQAMLQGRGWVKTDDNDAYLAEELFHDKAALRLERFYDGPVKSFMAAIKAAGVTDQEVHDYLYARHAADRNAYIAGINKKIPYAGSGMFATRAERAQALANGFGHLQNLRVAEDILADFARAGKTRKMQALAAQYDAITQMQRDVIRNEGLEEDDTVDAWEMMGNGTYVPLKGGQEGAGKGIGTGFNVKKSGTRSALGRQSEAENILANTFAQVGATLIRAEKVPVGRAFLKMVEQNPDPDLWIIHNKLPTTRVKATNPAWSKLNKEIAVLGQMIRDPQYAADRLRLETLRQQKIAQKANTAQETVQDVPDRSWASNEDNQVLTVTRDDGTVVYIEIMDNDLARPMKNVGGAQYTKFMSAMASTMRFLSAVRTSLNPEFMLTNLARDLQTAFVNMTGETSAKLAVKVMKGVPGAMVGIREKVRKGTVTGDWAQWYNRFREAGGGTSFLDLRGVDDWQRKIENMSKDGLLNKGAHTFDQLTKVISDYNTVIESAVRLSAFRTAVESGMSEPRAASLAKNMTVNFNRKGELGPAVNAFYMFANAGIQGGARIIQAIASSRKVQGMMGASVLIGYALAQAARASGGGDDDGMDRWDKVSDFTKQTNFIFMKEDGSTVTIRMPYGYNFFVAAGYALNDFVHREKNGKDVVDSAKFMTSAMMNAFNPFGGDDEPFKQVLPTLLDPFYEVAVNENFMGKKISPENFPFGAQKPDSQLFFRGTTEVSKSIASGLNTLTGGDELEAGGIDISPGTIDHMAQFVTGGLGSFVGRLVDIPQKAAKGDLKVNDIPFARQAFREPTPYADFELFYSNINRVTSSVANLKEKEGAAREAFRAKHPEIQLRVAANNYRDRMSALRKRYHKARDAGDMATARQVEKEMQALALKFNKRYNELVLVKK